VIVALRVKVLGQAPVKVNGEALAATPVTLNGTGEDGVGLTVVIADLVTVPVELVALMV
jgi:hypothetical protein